MKNICQELAATRETIEQQEEKSLKKKDRLIEDGTGGWLRSCGRHSPHKNQNMQFAGNYWAV